MPRKKRITTEEFVEEERQFVPPDPRLVEEDETLDHALKELGGGDGLELKYYLVKASGTEFKAVSPVVISEVQLQDMVPEGGRWEVRIYVNGEFRDRRFIAIGSRPGGVPMNGHGSGSDSYLREQMADLKSELRLMRSAPQSSALELAQAMAALQAISQPRESTNPLETVKLAMELAKMIKGVPEEDGSFLGIVKDVVKEAGPSLLQGLMKGNPALPPSAIPTPSPDEQTTAALKQGIAFLKKKALAGADPGLYIDFAIDNREGELFAPILHAVLTQQFEIFAAVDPEISKPPYVEFFRTIYDGLRSNFTPTDSVVLSGSGPTGNVSDAGNHAKPRKTGSA